MWGMKPRTMVDVRSRTVPARRVALDLRKAVARGIRWKRPGTPPTGIGLTADSDAPLPPWVTACLLDLALRGVRGEDANRALRGAPRDVDPEKVVAALEAHARTLGLRGAALVNPSCGLRDPETRPSTDLALTLVLLSKVAGGVFVAGKRPVLEAIRPRLLFLVWPALHAGSGEGA
jgi:hypothetical protein